MPRKKKRKSNAGRKPLFNTVKASWTNKGKTIRFTVSEDLAEEFKRAHGAFFNSFYQIEMARQRHDPYRYIRIEFVRFEELGIPAVLARIEQPTFNPTGHRLWKDKVGRRFFVQVQAKAIGVKEGQENVTIETLYAADLPGTLAGGMMFIFPDDYMEFQGAKDRAAIHRKPRVASRTTDKTPGKRSVPKAAPEHDDRPVAAPDLYGAGAPRRQQRTPRAPVGD